MKKKTLLSALLTASMVAGMLAGCGNDTGESSSQTESSSTQESSAETGSDEGTESSDAESASDSGETGSDAGGQSLLDVETLENPNVKVDLYWDPDVFEAAGIARYEEKFGEGTVTVNVIGWGKGIEVMNQNMSAGTVSDLIFTEGMNCFPNYVVDQYYQPITEYIKNDIGSSFLDEASVNNFKYIDDYYVFSNNAKSKPTLVAYYIPIFEDNALETPGELLKKGEWTWDKFLEYCDTLTVDTDGDGTIDQWGLGPRFNFQGFAYAADVIGIRETGDGYLAADWDNEKMLKYFEFITKLQEIQSRAKNADGEVFNDGWLGDGAMYMEAINQNQLANLDDDGNILGNNEDVSFVPLPTIDGSTAKTPVWDNGYAIPNGAPNPEGGAVLAAMIMDEYAKSLKENQKLYMTDEEIELYYDCMDHGVPARKNNGVYEGVTMNYGEAEAKEGTPAATIVDTYKDVVAGEVEAYNAKMKEKLGE